eukprot:687115-Amphidinium_carterae.1
MAEPQPAEHPTGIGPCSAPNGKHYDFSFKKRLLTATASFSFPTLTGLQSCQSNGPCVYQKNLVDFWWWHWHAEPAYCTPLVNFAAVKP